VRSHNNALAVSDETSGGQPYSSARDLPSIAEMLRLIEGGKLLTRVIARRVRPDLVQLERQVKELTDLVDRFYDVLGDRHWIFHEHLSIDEIREIVKLPADHAEQALIEIYKEREFLRSQIRMMRRFEAMRVRMHLVERALDDYLDGRYYATVLTLLAVMDGFVNDLDSQHRGLHTRDEDEMHAWDSIVGHHLGLTNAHRTFRKSFSKFSDEPVTELYRNGILHGNLVNFDNDIVATKAWNRLLAVCDWATSREKQAIDPEPKPSWADLLARAKATQEMKAALDAWTPSVLTDRDAEFLEHPAYVLSNEFLSAWHRQNFGRMGELLAAMIQEGTLARTAGMVRDQYDHLRLEGFRILQIELTSPVAANVHVELTLEARTLQAQLLCFHETRSGDLVLTNRPGHWRLVLWTPPV
jgi:hypothetical protein